MKQEKKYNRKRTVIFKYSKEHFRMIEDEWWRRYNLNTNVNR